MSNSPDLVVQVRKADSHGRVTVVASFQNDGYVPAQNQAIEWVAQQRRSDGLSIVEVHASGDEYVIG